MIQKKKKFVKNTKTKICNQKIEVVHYTFYEKHFGSQIDQKILLFVLDLHVVESKVRKEFLEILDWSEDKYNSSTYKIMFESINNLPKDRKEKIMLLSKKYLLEKI